MNCSQSKTSYFQMTLLIGAMLAGFGVAKILPERHPLAAYVPQTETIPTAAVFKQANTSKSPRDASRELTGIDVDVRRLTLLGRIS